MVNTSAKFKDRYVPIKGVVTHSHGAGGEHAHRDIAFTTWIDFNLAAGQAWVVADAMGRKKPALKAVFQKNYADLKKDLLELDQQLKALTASDPAKPLVGSHPVYDYLAARYGLNIKSVHWEPDAMPGNDQWKELVDLRKDHPAKWMIWESAPVGETIEKLKSIGVESLVFDPCGNVPDQGDFLSVMRENLNNIQQAF
jgi:zinc transport system substrate-binding protein